MAGSSTFPGAVRFYTTFDFYFFIFPLAFAGCVIFVPPPYRDSPLLLISDN
jgi:hypothetical protein